MYIHYRIISIYIDQDFVLGVTYAYIVQDFVLGVGLHMFPIKKKNVPVQDTACSAD